MMEQNVRSLLVWGDNIPQFSNIFTPYFTSIILTFYFIFFLTLLLNLKKSKKFHKNVHIPSLDPTISVIILI